MSTNLQKERFYHRHIASDKEQISDILDQIQVQSLDELMDEVIPNDIRLQHELELDEPMSEYRFLEELKKMSSKNEIKNRLSDLGITKQSLQMSSNETSWKTPAGTRLIRLIRQKFRKAGWKR